MGLAMAWGNRGAAKLNLNDFDGAIADLTEALSQDPCLQAAWCNRSLARIRQGDYDGAIADCGEELFLDAGNASTWSRRAGLKLSKGDYHGAVADCGEALALNSEQHTAWACRGKARFWNVMRCKTTLSHWSLSTLCAQFWNALHPSERERRTPRIPRLVVRALR